LTSLGFEHAGEIPRGLLARYRAAVALYQPQDIKMPVVVVIHLACFALAVAGIIATLP